MAVVLIKILPVPKTAKLRLDPSSDIPLFHLFGNFCELRCEGLGGHPWVEPRQININTGCPVRVY